MAVSIAVSTGGHYQTFSSENATLATALSEVLNEMATHEISFNQTRFVLDYDETNNKHAFVAICRKS